jgi:hypothetical protein
MGNYLLPFHADPRLAGLLVASLLRVGYIRILSNSCTP